MPERVTLMPRPLPGATTVSASALAVNLDCSGAYIGDVVAGRAVK